MATDSRPASPRSSRIVGIDTARGIAVAGMILVNVGPHGDEGPLHRLYMFPWGRASMLFVVIAGVVLTLQSRSANGLRWPILVWRAAVLVAIGVALELMPHGVNVILPVYGALFVAALVLRRLPTRALLAIAGFMAIAGPAAIIADGGAAGTAVRESGPVATVGDAVHLVLLSGPYPLVVWIVPFCAGMVVGRLDLRDPVVQRRLLAGGSVVAVVAAAVGYLAPPLVGSDSGWALLLTAAAHGQMPLWLLSAIGSALAVLGAVLLLPWRFGRVLAPFSSVGRLALTLYAAHLVVLALIRPGDDITFARGVLVTGCILSASLVLAALWERYAGIGPLEALLRARRRAPSPAA